MPMFRKETTHDKSEEQVRQQSSDLQQQTGRRPSLTALDKLDTAQQGIFDHQQLLQIVLQASPLAVNFLDTDGCVILWNPAAEMVFGWQADEVIGQISPIIDDENQAEFWAYHQAILAGQSPPAIRQRCQCKTGRQVMVTLSAAPITDSGGAIIGVVNFFTDVAEYSPSGDATINNDGLFRSVMEQSTDGIVLLNDQGVIVEWSSAQERWTGIPRAQAIGQFIWDAQYQLTPQKKRTPATYESYKQRMAQLLETQDAPWLNQLSDFPFERSDGECGITQLLTFPIHINGRFMVGSIWRDVTLQKRMEEALRESEERFHAIFDLAQDAIYIKNRDLVYTHVNPIVEKQNNRPAAEIIGKTVDDLFDFDPEAAAQTTAIDLRVLAGEVIEQIVTKPTGGIPRTFHSIKVPIRDKSGEIIGLCGFARDVTERQRAEDELRESEERYRALVDNSPVGIFVMEVEGGRYIFSNPAGAQLLSLASPDEIVGMPALEPIAPIDRARIRRSVEVSPREIIPPMEITLNRSDGTSIIAESTAVPIKLKGKTAVLIITQNITERKLAQEQALALEMERQRSQVLTEFIQNASHEFRTPLSIINANLYLLSKMVDSSCQNERIQRMEAQVQQITDLIQAMLTMSRLDSGVPLTFMPTDINQLVKNILVHIQPRAEQKQLSLKLDLTDQPSLQSDQKGLHQALLSVFENALAFTGEGGSITTRISGDDNHVTITIQDTGIGIESDDLPHIFERFYRADKARTTRGAGLGLSIAKKIIEDHHGMIHVDSTPGQGTTVLLTLPCQQVE
jgi:PAS domain S-box-containing protein